MGTDMIYRLQYYVVVELSVLRGVLMRHQAKRHLSNGYFEKYGILV